MAMEYGFRIMLTTVIRVIIMEVMEATQVTIEVIIEVGIEATTVVCIDKMYGGLRCKKACPVMILNGA